MTDDKKSNHVFRLGENMLVTILATALMSIVSAVGTFVAKDLEWPRPILIGCIALSIVFLVLSVMLFLRRRRFVRLREYSASVKCYFSTRMHPLPVAEIMAQYLRRCGSHLFLGKVELDLRGYLDLLSDSLAVLTNEIARGAKVEMFATSLLPPMAWKDDKSGVGIMAYWDKQVALAKSKQGDFHLTRVFILDNLDQATIDGFNSDALIQCHKDLGFEVYVCDKRTIERVSPQFVLDTAIYNTRLGEWAIESPLKEPTTGVQLHRVLIVDNKIALASWYNGLKNTLMDNRVWPPFDVTAKVAPE